MRRTAVLVTVFLFLAACASSDLADQGDRSRAGNPEVAEREKSKEAKGNDDSGSTSAATDTEEIVEEEIEEAPQGGGPKSVDAPTDFGGTDAPSSGVDQSLSRSSVAISDPSSDSKHQGLTPQYAEATGATIQGLGNNVRFVMSFNGNVPASVNKGQYMVMAFGITGRKEGEGFAVGATCDEQGWKPYAGSKGDSKKFPGTFDVTGTEIVMELPWRFIEGPRAFEWYASTGWYGTVANQTHWSFDSVPNGKAGDFPN